jgi:hypothetical protein
MKAHWHIEIKIQVKILVKLFREYQLNQYPTWAGIQQTTWWSCCRDRWRARRGSARWRWTFPHCCTPASRVKDNQPPSRTSWLNTTLRTSQRSTYTVHEQNLKYVLSSGLALFFLVTSVSFILIYLAADSYLHTYRTSPLLSVENNLVWFFALL